MELKLFWEKQIKKGDKQNYVLSPFENLRKANVTVDYKFKLNIDFYISDS
jgi:hypothetical protein